MGDQKMVAYVAHNVRQHGRPRGVAIAYVQVPEFMRFKRALGNIVIYLIKEENVYVY